MLEPPHAWRPQTVGRARRRPADRPALSLHHARRDGHGSWYGDEQPAGRAVPSPQTAEASGRRIAHASRSHSPAAGDPTPVISSSAPTGPSRAVRGSPRPARRGRRPPSPGAVCAPRRPAAAPAPCRARQADRRPGIRPGTRGERSPAHGPSHDPSHDPSRGDPSRDDRLRGSASSTPCHAAATGIPTEARTGPTRNGSGCPRLSARCAVIAGQPTRLMVGRGGTAGPGRLGGPGKRLRRSGCRPTVTATVRAVPLEPRRHWSRPRRGRRYQSRPRRGRRHRSWPATTIATGAGPARPRPSPPEHPGGGNCPVRRPGPGSPPRAAAARLILP